MSEFKFVDLAVVEEYNTRSRYVVQLPPWEAVIGGLIEFEADAVLSLGQIISKITTSLDNEVYGFTGAACGIIPAKRWWIPGKRDDHADT